MKIRFLKCHGTGNDFILIDEISCGYSFTEEQRAGLARTLCRRNGIIGADGILFVQKSTSCDARMRIFNADGTEPEMCGNGLRCVVRYAAELLGKDRFTVETMKSNYSVGRMPDIYKGVVSVSVELESVSFDLADMPMTYKGKSELFMEPVKELDGELKFSAGAISNPHIVSVVDNIDTEQLVAVGTKVIEAKNIFPRGINVNFVKLLGKEMIYVRTFERGVGLTKSCGTGMISSAITACRHDKSLLGREVKIFNDGGMIKCIVDMEGGKYKVKMIGNATKEYEAELDFDFAENAALPDGQKKYFEDEAKAYEGFLAYTRKIVEEAVK